jgi:hypothetical protein
VAAIALGGRATRKLIFAVPFSAMAWLIVQNFDLANYRHRRPMLADFSGIML